MKVTANNERNQFIVTTSKGELIKAFTTEHELQKFLHELCANTYGEALANDLFPLCN